MGLDVSGNLCHILSRACSQCRKSILPCHGTQQLIEELCLAGGWGLENFEIQDKCAIDRMTSLFIQLAYRTD